MSTSTTITVPTITEPTITEPTITEPTITEPRRNLLPTETTTATRHAQLSGHPRSWGDIESMLAWAGIGFEVVHDGPGSSCRACPRGVDLAA